MTNPDAVAAFKAAWEEADRRGDVGHRVEAGLAAALGVACEIRTITTPAELDALPVMSVVLDRHVDVWQKVDDTERLDEDGDNLRTAWASVSWKVDRTAQEMFDGMGTEPSKCGPFRLLHDAGETR